jgi:hypothetical protein
MLLAVLARVTMESPHAAYRSTSAPPSYSSGLLAASHLVADFLSSCGLTSRTNTGLGSIEKLLEFHEPGVVSLAQTLLDEHFPEVSDDED